jgi:hypothetical protein
MMLAIGLALLVVTALWAVNEHRLNKRSEALGAPADRMTKLFVIIAQIILALAGIGFVALAL